jgi:hypothetical protein
MAKKTERKLPPPSIGKGTPVKWRNYIGVISEDHLDPGGMRGFFLVTFYLSDPINGEKTRAVQAYIEAEYLVPLRADPRSDEYDIFLHDVRCARVLME